MSDIAFKEKVKKVFISQPFSDFTNEEIEDERDRIKEVLGELIYGKFEILPNYQPMPEGKNNLWCLGRSLQYLSEADIIFFSDVYLDIMRLKSKGCMIENLCNMLYNENIIAIYECGLEQYLKYTNIFENFIAENHLYLNDDYRFNTNISLVNKKGGYKYVIVRRINSEKII